MLEKWRSSSAKAELYRARPLSKLREAVKLESDARFIVLDVSRVSAIEGGGLGMLVSLHRWANDHDIRLKLFNPRLAVRQTLEHASSMQEFDLATLDEIMALLACPDSLARTA
jgi:anti-anti-sigma regulatory factor